MALGRRVIEGALRRRVACAHASADGEGEADSTDEAHYPQTPCQENFIVKSKMRRRKSERLYVLPAQLVDIYPLADTFT